MVDGVLGSTKPKLEAWVVGEEKFALVLVARPA